MGDGGLAAAFQYGSNAAEVEHGLGALKKFAPRTKCGQEPRTVNCAATGESVKERSVVVLREGASDLAIVAADGGVGGARRGAFSPSHAQRVQTRVQQSGIGLFSKVYRFYTWLNVVLGVGGKLFGPP